MTAAVLNMNLIVKIDGGVQETNLAEFEKAALSVIENINTDLQTDEDFASAENTIKECKIVEDRLDQAKQDAMHNIDDISALFTLMDKLKDKFRDTRLELNRKVKKEKESRKSEIVNKAHLMIAGMLIERLDPEMIKEWADMGA